jgi:hypothetical protein
MSLSAEQLVQEIHDSPTRIVLAAAGGGSRAIAELLDVPGGSRTLLEAVVPYAAPALAAWLGSPPDEACSAATARAMAMVAFLRARQYGASISPLPSGEGLEVRAGEEPTPIDVLGKQSVQEACSQTELGNKRCSRAELACSQAELGNKSKEPPARVAGVACTASLATDRPKRGPHRIHIALQTAATTAAWWLPLNKDRRTRAEEERLAGRMVLNAVAEACGVQNRLALDLLEGEQVQESRTQAPPTWQDLLLSRIESIRIGEGPSCGAAVPTAPAGETPAPQPAGETPAPQPAGGTPAPQALFAGAFNPLHVGHRRMAEIARETLQQSVALEISILNVDKPPLDYLEIGRRLGQFPNDVAVYLTRAATFEEKSRLFPGATFVVGTDTLRRIAEPRYYGGPPARDCAIERIAQRGCRFLVFGRNLGNGFVRLSDLDLPEPLRILCREVPPEVFCEDVSSTAIRQCGRE